MSYLSSSLTTRSIHRSSSSCWDSKLCRATCSGPSLSTRDLTFHVPNNQAEHLHLAPLRAVICTPQVVCKSSVGEHSWGASSGIIVRYPDLTHTVPRVQSHCPVSQLCHNTWHSCYTRSPLWGRGWTYDRHTHTHTHTHIHTHTHTHTHTHAHYISRMRGQGYTHTPSFTTKDLPIWNKHILPPYIPGRQMQGMCIYR